MPLDNQTLIHVGTELVIIAGLSFWVHKRFTNVDNQIYELTKKMSHYEDMLEQFKQILGRHEGIIRHSLGQPTFETSPKPSKPSENNTKSKIVEEEEVEIETTEEDLDSLLKEEIKDLGLSKISEIQEEEEEPEDLKSEKKKRKDKKKVLDGN